MSSLPSENRVLRRQKIENITMNPREFVKDYSIKSLVCSFSGGKDSLVATHFTFSEVEGMDVNKYVVHADTTVMLPGNLEFVGNVCKAFDWDLRVVYPKVDFWTHVKNGMPMPTMFRRWCCGILKLEPIHDFVKTLPPQRAEVTGLRRDESVRRRKLKELFYLKSSRVWKYAPILEWAEKDVLRYMKEHNLPMPPHYAMGIKETCMCGAFSNKRQIAILRARYPEFFQKFVELEKSFKKGGAAFYFQNKPTYAKDFLKQKTLVDQNG